MEEAEKQADPIAARDALKRLVTLFDGSSKGKEAKRKLRRLQSKHRRFFQAEKILRRATCPVLIVKPRGE